MRARCPAFARSVLVNTMRSATAACFTASGMGIERGFAVHRVDHRHHAVEPVAQHEIRMRHGGVQHRRRIGEAGRLQQHAAERAAPVVEIAQQRFQRVDQIAAHGAAQAARLQQHHVVADIFDQQMVERDVAELVDDDGGVGSAGSFSRRLSSVVLPAPRKPVSTVKAIGSGGRRRAALLSAALIAPPTDLRFRRACACLAACLRLDFLLWPCASCARALLRLVGMIGGSGEHDDRRLGFDRRAEHEFAVRPASGSTAGSLAPSRRRRWRSRRRPALLRYYPRRAACGDGRRTSRSRRLGGCASIGASASTVPSEGVSQDKPPLLNPRSSICAAFCARTAPE